MGSRCASCKAEDARQARARRAARRALYESELQRWEDDLHAMSYGYDTEAADLVERGDIRPRPVLADYLAHARSLL